MTATFHRVGMFVGNVITCFGERAQAGGERLMTTGGRMYGKHRRALHPPAAKTGYGDITKGTAAWADVEILSHDQRLTWVNKDDPE